MKKWNLMIHGVRFEYLLCSLYAATPAEARHEAKKHVEEWEVWRIVQAD